MMPADATSDMRGGTQGLDRRCRLWLTSTPTAPWPNPACPFVEHCSMPGGPTLSQGCSLAVCLGFPVCKEGMMTASLFLHPPYLRSGPRNSLRSSTPYPQCSYYSHAHQTGCQDHGHRVLERPCQHSALLFQVPGPAQPPASSPCPGLGLWTLDLTAVVRGGTLSLIPSTEAPWQLGAPQRWSCFQEAGCSHLGHLHRQAGSWGHPADSTGWGWGTWDPGLAAAET